MLDCKKKERDLSRPSNLIMNNKIKKLAFCLWLFLGLRYWFLGVSIFKSEDRRGKTEALPSNSVQPQSSQRNLRRKTEDRRRKKMIRNSQFVIAHLRAQLKTHNSQPITKLLPTPHFPLPAPNSLTIDN